MAAQYMSKANVAIAYLSTDDLEELLSNDEKLEERNSDVVSGITNLWYSVSKFEVDYYYLLLSHRALRSLK